MRTLSSRSPGICDQISSAIDIVVQHIHWIKAGDLVIHYVQEQANVAGQSQQQPPVYATNIYRKGTDGWHMVLHQNSPTPPPVSGMPPM